MVVRSWNCQVPNGKAQATGCIGLQFKGTLYMHAGMCADNEILTQAITEVLVFPSVCHTLPHLLARLCPQTECASLVTITPGHIQMHVRPTQIRWREVTDLLPYMCTQASQELTTPSAPTHSLLPPTPLQLHSLHPFILPTHPTPTSPSTCFPHFTSPTLPFPPHSHFTQATPHPTPTSPKPHPIPLPLHPSHTPSHSHLSQVTHLQLFSSQSRQHWDWPAAPTQPSQSPQDRDVVSALTIGDPAHRPHTTEGCLRSEGLQPRKHMHVAMVTVPHSNITVT